jgi:hypothetical protein
MTPAEFQESGERLYGADWRKPLAAALGVNTVTVWRLAEGRSPISARTVMAVRSLLEAANRSTDA